MSDRGGIIAIPYTRAMSIEPYTIESGTISDWVRQAVENAGLFFGHGTATAEDEACWMVSHTLRWSPDFSSDRFEHKLTDSQRQALDDLLQRRIQTRQPLAYLIGEAWFAGLRFAVGPAALIPRSPLAELIVDGMQPWLDLDQALDVLEIGTGSGCIAAALAWHWPALRVDAVDISLEALEIAKQNIERLGLTDRVQLLESDVFDALRDRNDSRQYDLIISNPPYVPDDSMKSLPDEYRHEPALALVAGPDGLAVVRRLVLEAPDYLRPEGWILVEVGEAQAAAERWLEAVDPIWLEFEHGGDGVFLLSRDACLKMRNAVQHPADGPKTHNLKN